MSESVKIGGIGKSPVIDKVNHINAVEIKGYAVNRMDQVILSSDPKEYENYMEVPIDIKEEIWKGE